MCKDTTGIDVCITEDKECDGTDDCAGGKDEETCDEVCSESIGLDRCRQRLSSQLT